MLARWKKEGLLVEESFKGPQRKPVKGPRSVIAKWPGGKA